MLQYIAGFHIAIATNVFRCFQIKTAEKAGEPAKQDPFGRSKQIIAPIHGSAERLMALK